MLSEIENMLHDLEISLHEEECIDSSLDYEEIYHITECIFNMVYKECAYLIMEYNYRELWTNIIQFEISNYFDMLPIQFNNSQNEENIQIIHENVLLLLETQIIPRSEHTMRCTLLNDTEAKIEHLRKINKSAPKQRTEEWFEIRNTCISASSLWKVMHTQSTKNQIIYEKCVGSKHIKMNSINSPLHWGQKYEPVAQSVYETLYNTTIEEYGCIIHPEYSFLGASPDGLNVNKNSDRYGRLLEIKCIKNRELTGIPKKEYWIQMQSQMECCDIDVRDFLECRFLEYESKEKFENNGTFTRTANNQFKGLMLCFLNEENQPFYMYKPFDFEKQETEKWIENTLENTKFSFVHTYYWYLQEYSCVSVERNKLWFSQTLPHIKQVWDTIIYERANGFDHRKPTPKPKPKLNTRTNNVLCINDSFDSEGKCLVMHVDI